MSFTKQLRHAATRSIVRFLLLLFNAVPRRLAMWLGSALGLLAWRVLPRERFRINRHLEAAYGDSITFRERQLIGRSFFVHTGKNIAELLRFRGHFDSEIKNLVDVEGRENFEAAFRRGKGVFGVTGHLGNFELLAAMMQSLGYPSAVIGREMYDKKLDELLVANRTAVGLVNIPTTDSPRRILEWLKTGGAVGVLIDTDSWRVRSEMIPAFGRLSNTPIGQSLIALKTGAALVPLACVRTEDDRYRLIIRPEVTIDRTGDNQADAIELTRRCTAVLEEIINQYRDQWIWLHNRWHTRVENIA